MTYDAELVPVDMFNVPIKLPVSVVADIHHEISSSSDFHRYETVRGMVNLGTFWMHRPEVVKLVEELSAEGAALWQKLHNKSYALARKAERDMLL